MKLLSILALILDDYCICPACQQAPSLKALSVAKGSRAILRPSNPPPHPESICLFSNFTTSQRGWASEKQCKPVWASAGSYITPPPPPSSDFFLPYVHTHAHTHNHQNQHTYEGLPLFIFTLWYLTLNISLWCRIGLQGSFASVTFLFWLQVCSFNGCIQNKFTFISNLKLTVSLILFLNSM